MHKIITIFLTVFAFTFVKAQTICIDTIMYPQSKTTGFSGFLLLSEGSFTRGISQTYNANTGLIHGIRALVLLDTNGVVGDHAPLDVYIKVFNVNGIDKPVGAAIDSTLVTVTDVGMSEQTLLFSSPIAVSSRYAVAVELNPATAAVNSDTLWYVTNDPSLPTPDGRSEGLFSIDFTPGDSWFNFWNEFNSAADNVDVMLSPIFDKVITASYTTDVDSVVLGGDVVFTNTSVIDTNYMYNRWDSLNTDIYSWNYNDGTGIYGHEDTTYTYNSSGSLNAQLIITNYGYTGNCVDTANKDIEVIYIYKTVSDRQVTFHVADSITLFNSSLIFGTLVFDEKNYSLWSLNELGTKTMSLSTTSKTLISSNISSQIPSGSVYINSIITTNISSVNVPTKILGTTLSEHLNLFDTDENDNRLRYLGVKTKVFTINASISKTSAANNKLYSVYIYKYDSSLGIGSIIESSKIQSKISTGSDVKEASITCLVSLDNNDYIECWIENNTDSTNPTVILMNLLIK